MNHKFFPVDPNAPKRKSTNLLSKMDETLNAMELDLYPKASKPLPKKLSTLSEASSTSVNTAQQQSASAEQQIATTKEQIPLVAKSLPNRPISTASLTKSSSRASKLSLISDRPSSLTDDDFTATQSNKLNDYSAVSSLRAVSMESISQKSDASSFKTSKPFRVLGVDVPIVIPSKDLPNRPTDDLDVGSPKRQTSLSHRLSMTLAKKDYVASDINTIPTHVPSTSKALKTLGVDVITPTPANKRSSMSRNLMNLFTAASGNKRMSSMSSISSAYQQGAASSPNSIADSKRLSKISNIDNLSATPPDVSSDIPSRRSSLSASQIHTASLSVAKQTSKSTLYSEIVQEATPANSDTEESAQNLKVQISGSGSYSDETLVNISTKGDKPEVVSVAQANQMRKFVSGYLGKTPVLMAPLQTSFFVLTIDGLFEFKGHEDHHKSVSVITIDKSTTITIPNPNELVIQLSTQNGQQTDTCYLTSPGKTDMDIWVRGFTNAIHLDIYSKLPLPPTPSLKEDALEEIRYNGNITALKRLISGLVPADSTENVNFVKISATKEKFPASIISALSILECLVKNERKKM